MSSASKLMLRPPLLQRMIVGLRRKMLGRRAGTRKVVELASLAIPSGLGDSAWLLYGLVRARKPELCVEIGSAQGWSACFIAAALEDNQKGKIIAIDPHVQTEWNDVNAVDTHEIFHSNVRKLGLTHRVEVVRRFSPEVSTDWRTQIDLLFIDGDHSYEGVKRDWELFSPHVSKFGAVIFHDTIWEVGEVNENYRRENMGVPRFVDELRARGYQVVTLPYDYGVSVIQPTLNGVPLTDRKEG